MDTKFSRYGLPQGEIWLANDGKSFATASNKDQAEYLLKFTETKLNIIANNVIAKYRDQCKQPMLIVGANSFIRDNMPFFVLEHYDIHLFFYPTSESAYVVEAMAWHKQHHNSAPIVSYYAHNEPKTALLQAMWRIIPQVLMKDESEAFKAARWLTHWIYRCPKVSIADIFHLESYDKAAHTYSELKELVNIKPIFRAIEGQKDKVKELINVFGDLIA
jgi:hypothetical protein